MFALTPLILLCVVLPGPLPAKTGSIGGVVVQGAARPIPVPGAEVALRVKSGDEFLLAAETITDANGHFLFQPLPIRSDLQYVPGANRAGVHYPGRRIRLTPQHPNVNVELVVYDAIEEPSPLIAQEHDIVIQCEQGFLRITETILIDNPTLTSYVGHATDEDAEPVTMQLAIPSDFERTTFHKEFFGRRFAWKDGKLVTSIPWTPGPKELAFTYVLRNTEARRVWERSLDLPCSYVRVRIENCDPEDVNCNLESSSRSSSNTAMFEYQGAMLPAGYVVRVEMGRLPMPWMTYGRWLAPLILIALIAGGTMAMFKRRGTAEQQDQPVLERPHSASHRKSAA